MAKQIIFSEETCSKTEELGLNLTFQEALEAVQP